MAIDEMTTCPACGRAGLEIFHHETGIPTNSALLLEDPEEARTFPRGDMRLGFCGACGFITNTAFDPGLTEYSDRFEESQAFSTKFQEYAHWVSKRWADRYDLRGRHLLEIGCGAGEFLEIMVAETGGTATAIDPAVRADRLQESGPIDWIADFYSPEYRHLTADAVVCRHTLEHIHPVGEFMRMLRANLGDDAKPALLFELPDTLRVLREVAFWDVFYTHCSYFTAGSLTRLFQRTGFDVLDVEMVYDDQYLIMEARPGQAPGEVAPAVGGIDDLDEIRAAVAHFAESYQLKIAQWRDELRQVRERGARIVIWGGGSKGVGYLTGLQLTDEVEYAVDINPRKQGMYMAGTGQQIVSPEFLQEYRPDLVVVMNPAYCEEIQRDLDRLGVRCEMTSL